MARALQDDEIRILEILPGAIEDSLRCNFDVARLSSEPTYDAISYRWGDALDQTQICVDGRPISVTSTVSQILHRLRLSDQKRPVWIDQLCINQADQDEKISQIRLMGQIYSRCRLGVVWLNELHPDVPLKDAEAAFELLTYPHCDHAALLESAEALHGALKALQTIGPDSHEWWKRAWTAQEAVLPPTLRLVWGPLELSWDRFEKASLAWKDPEGACRRLVEQMTMPEKSLIRAFFAWVPWIKDSRSPSRSAATRFFHSSRVSLRFRHRQAADARDRAFALLGMMPRDELKYTLQVSYSNSAAEVYSAFTMDLILQDGLCAWATEVRADPPKATEDMPSWAVDLPHRPEHWAADGYFRVWNYLVYDACGGRQLDYDAFSREADSIEEEEAPGEQRRAGLFKTIALTGLEVDVVEIVSTNRYLFENRKPDASRIAKMVRTWMDVARSYRRKIDAERSGDQQIVVDDDELETDFCSLVMGDLFRDRNQIGRRFLSHNDKNKVSKFLDTGVWDESWQTMKCLRSQICSQAFFITRKGLIGLASLDTAPGDEVWVFDGGKVPFTMRRKDRSDDGNYTFGGYCYTQGIMRREISIYEDLEAGRIEDDGDLPSSVERIGPLSRRRTIRIH